MVHKMRPGGNNETNDVPVRGDLVLSILVGGLGVSGAARRARVCE